MGRRSRVLENTTKSKFCLELTEGEGRNDDKLLASVFCTRFASSAPSAFDFSQLRLIDTFLTESQALAMPSGAPFMTWPPKLHQHCPSTFQDET